MKPKKRKFYVVEWKHGDYWCRSWNHQPTLAMAKVSAESRDGTYRIIEITQSERRVG